MDVREIDLNGDALLASYLNSGFEDAPPAGRLAAKAFSYDSPTLRPGKTRGVVRLATTDMLFAAVQTFASGGEKVRHSHAAMDGFWLVLKGLARFYIEDEPPVDLPPMAGITIPRGVEYWFETVGTVALEILQVDAIAKDRKNSLTVDEGTAGKFDPDAIAVFDALDE